ncbi:MAG TPA: ferritin-like domain-containing protein, partial [Streptosporangiaceae bacterium]|nr:ferritin-like domain-containing protein [Streptosporangiaceae bacterium]
AADASTLAALRAALAAEQAASYGYGVAGAHLTGQRFAAASADCIAHERARDRLASMISARGGRPQPAAAAYQLPVEVGSQAAARSLAVLLERRVAAAYLGLVTVPDAALRRFGAVSMRDCAVRATRWSGRSQAFPGLPPSSLRSPP